MAPEDDITELHAFCRTIQPWDPPTKKFVALLDPGIAEAVVILRDHGVETHQSCQGGEGHAYFVPTVDFQGGAAAGYKAVSVARQHGLPVRSLQRVWNVQGDDIHEVFWRIVFWQGKRSVGFPVPLDLGIVAAVADDPTLSAHYGIQAEMLARSVRKVASR
jgi:hypothetical protein